MDSAQYAFGDSVLAGERLEILARLFAPPTRSILAAAPTSAPNRVADLGCGPGHTTALLADIYPDASITGFDASPAFVEAADAQGLRATFTRADVTRPLQGAPYDLIYARFLLAHLPAPVDTIAGWCDALAPGGALVLEETESITTTDPELARYERLTVGIVESKGAALYAGPIIETATLPSGFRRAVDRVIDIDLTAGEAASMFWRNLATWGPDAVAVGLATEPEIIELLGQLRAREPDPMHGCFERRQRQTVIAPLGP